MRYAGRILRHVTAAQIRLHHADVGEWIVGVVIAQQARNLKSGNGDLGNTGGDAVVQADIGGEVLQAGVQIQQAFRRENRLVVYPIDGVARAQGSATVAENIPGHTYVRRELVI